MKNFSLIDQNLDASIKSEKKRKKFRIEQSSVNTFSDVGFRTKNVIGKLCTFTIDVFSYRTTSLGEK